METLKRSDDRVLSRRDIEICNRAIRKPTSSSFAGSGGVEVEQPGLGPYPLAGFEVTTEDLITCKVDDFTCIRGTFDFNLVSWEGEIRASRRRLAHAWYR